MSFWSMKEEQTQSLHLFPSAFYHQPLETWVDALRREPSEAEQCLLEQVVHYKARSRMEHEFLIVHASHPSGRRIVLGADRNKAAFCASVDSTSSPPPSSSSMPAVDAVWVSDDGTPEPILNHNAPSDPLSTISFTPSPDAAGSPRPSLLHLSAILLAIHGEVPSYVLLEYQCYFFAGETCLALVELCGGEKTAHPKGWRAGTWCGVQVSYWSAASAAMPNFLLVPFLHPITHPALIIPTGLLAAYNAVRIHKRHDVQRAFDRLKIKSTCRSHSDIARLNV